ncbi:putative Signal peptidase subunit [Trypanosoma vivax]|uniref:Signal peptidase complex subunit 3 n=1 Tax=Trypanosoma vivax (strain Y486) TaxID=1055687 RepID=G0TVG3_TRYVY|nr:hypothetical protein TRVL_01145 [Trypanosoma vivax]KAH8612084.1 putative Signal peptidase subunit [Trypanosoma vivax]CCC47929.1 conserved hypothetical protein [Trypanosoma vivax Y486]
MHSFALRTAELTSMAMMNCLTGLVLIIGCSFIPLWHSKPTAVITDFNMSMSPLVRARLPYIFAQGEFPPPLRDMVVFAVSLNADFSMLWDWNVKHVYAACVARYKSRGNVTVAGVNPHETYEVVIIDAVLRTKEEASAWKVVNAQKYALESAQLGSLAGVEVEFVIQYQLIRHYGYSPRYEVRPLGRERALVKLPSKFHVLTEDEEKEGMCRRGYS